MANTGAHNVIVAHFHHCLYAQSPIHRAR